MTGQTLGAVREVSLLIVFNFNYKPSKLDITKFLKTKNTCVHMSAIILWLQIYKIAGPFYMLPHRRVCDWAVCLRELSHVHASVVRVRIMSNFVIVNGVV